MSELKKCPFCGGEAKLLKGLCELDNYFMCLNCRIKTKLYNTKAAAIKAWNTRKPMDKIVERLEELKQKEYDTEERCNDEGFYNDVEDAYEDGESQGLFSGFAQAIKIIKEEGGV